MSDFIYEPIVGNLYYVKNKLWMSTVPDFITNNDQEVWCTKNDVLLCLEIINHGHVFIKFLFNGNKIQFMHYNEFEQFVYWNWLECITGGNNEAT